MRKPFIDLEVQKKLKQTRENEAKHNAYAAFLMQKFQTAREDTFLAIGKMPATKRDRINEEFNTLMSEGKIDWMKHYSEDGSIYTRETSRRKFHG